MKIIKRIGVFLFLILFSFSGVSAAMGDTTTGDATTGNATTTSTNTSGTNNNVEANQMLQQIQQLQAKQQQELAVQQGTATNSNNVAPANNNQYYSNSTNQNNTSASSAIPAYQSDFQYPYANAQIQQTQQDQQISQAAFSNSVTQVLPMNPQQIHRLKQIYEASQYAAAAPAGTPPEPTATSMYVNLSPGASPPAIRLSQGFVTSLVFLDSTGAAWPVDAYDLGNPTAFDIAWDKTDNVLMIQAKTLYTYGNLAVRLRGLNTPVMLTLIPGQQVIDYRVDITVPGFGPDAKAMSINTSLPPQAAPVLLDVLDGIPPEGSRQLEISDTIGEAWLLNGNMYVRTQYTLLSPGWLATMASADGTNAYQVQQTPMLLMSKNGKIINVKIGGL